MDMSTREQSSERAVGHLAGEWTIGRVGGHASKFMRFSNLLVYMIDLSIHLVFSFSIALRLL